MFGRIPAFRTTLAAAAFVAAASVAPAAARAQSPVTVNFNALVDTANAGVRQVDNCYTESGFTFTAVGLSCGTANTFAAAFPANRSAATGQTSLYLNSPATNMVDLTRVGGGQFGIQSIALAPFVGLGGTIGFTGYFANGLSTFQQFTVADASAFRLQPLTAFTFNSAFTGLTSLRMTIAQPDGNAYLNFDNLALTPAATAVPEPTTVALLAGGLFGVGMLARTRGSRRRAASAPIA